MGDSWSTFFKHYTRVFRITLSIQPLVKRSRAMLQVKASVGLMISAVLMVSTTAVPQLFPSRRLDAIFDKSNFMKEMSMKSWINSNSQVQPIEVDRQDTKTRLKCTGIKEPDAHVVWTINKEDPEKIKGVRITQDPDGISVLEIDNDAYPNHDGPLSFCCKMKSIKMKENVTSENVKNFCSAVAVGKDASNFHSFSSSSSSSSSSSTSMFKFSQVRNENPHEWCDRYLPGEPFLYQDLTQVPSSLWSPGEPQNEDCTEIRPDGKMNDITCFNNYPVCMDRNY